MKGKCDICEKWYEDKELKVIPSDTDFGFELRCQNCSLKNKQPQYKTLNSK